MRTVGLKFRAIVPPPRVDSLDAEFGSIFRVIEA